MAFCSTSCQSNEASKDELYTMPIIHDSYLSYHRRPSFTCRPLTQSLSTTSSLSDTSSIYSYSCDDKEATQYRITRTTS